MTSGKTPQRWRVGRVVHACLLACGIAALAGAAPGCGGNENRPATWTFISTAILEPSCATANCHSAIAQRASVDLSERAIGYQTLVNRQFVITQDIDPLASPDERVTRSPITSLMRAVGNIRMPPDMPLPEIDIKLIEAWIRDGATDN